MSPPRAAVFLDRDGTLIEDRSYLADPAGVVPLPGAIEAVAEMRAKGWPVIVVTNQSGVARGLLTTADFERVSERVTSVFGAFDAVYACFHLAPPEGRVAPFAVSCDCRKPLPGMLLRAAAERSIDLSASWGAGDSSVDVQAFRAAGVRPCLLPTQGAAAEARLSPADRSAVTRIRDLREIAAALPDRRTCRTA